MHIEQRSETVPFDFLSTLFTSTRLANPQVVSVPIQSHFHTEMFEKYTPNSEGPRDRWRSFEHYKAVHEKASNGTLLPCKLWLPVVPPQGGINEDCFTGYIPGRSYTAYYEATFGDPGLPIGGLPGLCVDMDEGGHFVPAPSNLEELKQRSLRSMLPLIKSELSLVNSVLELRDFKTLPQTIKRTVQVGSNILKYVSKIGRRVKGKPTLRNLLGSMRTATADGYLQAQFNLLPLLSDISGIYTALSRTERRLNDLITRAGRHQVKHYNFTWEEYTDSSQLASEQVYAADYLQYPPYAYYNVRRNCRYTPTTFHAEIRYNYVYSEYQVEHARILGLLDALGVNLNPAIIWNAIPWSFVVDWVIGVGRWLDQFKLPLMKPTINIQSYLWSVKRRRVIVLTRFTPVQASQSTLGPEIAMPALFETAYRRQVELPSINSLLTSGLDSKEFSLAAALVLARRRKHKH